jgi:hypothetical protein
MKRKVAPLAFLVLLAFSNCSKTKDDGTIVPDSDPFAATLAATQRFTIDSKQDTVIEGENGTLLVLPAGCFKDGNGDVFEGEVKIKLAEALSLGDMVLSNLTSTSDGKPLETDGMIYFDATTSDGEPLTINKDNPVHIEIPTAEKRPGMKVYRGIRDENGNMNWVDPKPLDNFLTTVSLDSLDFLPNNFQIAVDLGMPFRKYKTSTKKLTDSLYYSLSVFDPAKSQSDRLPTDANELYYDDKQRKPGKRTEAVDRIDKNGIDPAMIQVIKSPAYQNTFIATRDFEARLKVIFGTCENSVLDLYTHNLDKNLYEVDSMAAALCEEKKLLRAVHALSDFSQERLTKVKDSEKYAKILRGHYERELYKVKSALKKDKDKAVKALAEKTAEAEKVVADYKKLLWKREKYRMETYGFDWTETGWVNIDNGDLPKWWGSQALEITVENGREFDRVYTYVIYTSIKSLYRLNSTDNQNFYVGNEVEKEMLMPKHESAVSISIGYKGDVPALGIKLFETDSSHVSLSLTTSSIEEIKKALNKYQKYSKENKIESDLKFMEELYQFEQEQKNLMKENEFLKMLFDLAYPCYLEQLGDYELIEVIEEN